jgi:hypothetical protein
MRSFSDEKKKNGALWNFIDKAAGAYPELVWKILVFTLVIVPCQFNFICWVVYNNGLQEGSNLDVGALLDAILDCFSCFWIYFIGIFASTMSDNQGTFAFIIANIFCFVCVYMGFQELRRIFHHFKLKLLD